VKRGILFLLLLALAGPVQSEERDRRAPQSEERDRRAPQSEERDRRAAPLAAQRVAPRGTEFAQTVANGSSVNMTITNYGFYGNNYYNRASSCEYPANRGFEHLVRGGLWVGAQAQDTSEFIGVTTGTVDAAQGDVSPDATEFTPAGKKMLLRSTLLNSPSYARDAVSELDVVSEFIDDSVTTAASNSERHRPLRVKIRQENYQWGFGLFQHCLFFHITLQNTGAELDSAYLGIYTEFASGNKGGYVNWPPQTADASGLGFFFRKKWIQADDSLNLVREHYCADGPAPDGCQLQSVPYWIGLRYLGSRGVADDATVRKLTLAGWSWRVGAPDRDQDSERYALMKSGIWDDFRADTLQPHGIATGAPDPIELFCVGPFPVIPHNATVSADFAIVGGAEVADIQRHSKFAQFAYDHNYVVPVPPPSPRMHVEVRDNALDIYWDNSPEQACDVTSSPSRDFEGYRVYIGEDPDTLARVAQFDVASGDTAGFNTGFPMPVPRIHKDSLLVNGTKVMVPHYAEFKELRCDSVCQTDTLTCKRHCDPVPCVVDTTRYQYKYTVGNLRNGFKYYVAVTAYDLGNSQFEPTESGFNQNRVIAIPGPAPGEARAQTPTVFPNPYRVEARWDQGRNVRDHYLWFAGLPERCRLKVLTLSGDLVFEKEFDGSTYHGEGARGIYDPNKSLGQPILSGTTFGWNLITTEGQAVATGLYLYTVEDRATGNRTIGKFLVVKSDRDR
jgi:hypothetical protein